MNEFRMKATGQVLTEPEYLALHPNVSFPPNFVPVDADRVQPTEPPVAGKRQSVVRDGVVFSGNNWVQRWMVQDWTADEIEEDRQRARAATWALIKAERERRKDGGVQVSGFWFHSDTDSRIQWLALKDTARDMLAAGRGDTSPVYLMGQPIHWKTMAGTFVPVTVRLALDVVQAIKDRDGIAFARAETHRIAMEVADDPESYDFSTGWPAIYGGLT
jgi:hypothetical protein